MDCLRILVVDDSPATALTLAEWLKASGHQVRAAFGGPQAIEAARSFLPHLVIIDLSMPDMDGFRLSQELHGLPELKTATLAALTGHDSLDYRQRAIEAGIGHFFVKPMTSETLSGLVALVAP
jgi:CheY-like chemotaxis protein